MLKLFETETSHGYLVVHQVEEALIVRSAFRREASGVGIELPATEAADLTEALLKGLDRDTRLSVIESVLGLSTKNRLVQEAYVNEKLAPESNNGDANENQEGETMRGSASSLP